MGVESHPDGNTGIPQANCQLTTILKPATQFYSGL